MTVDVQALRPMRHLEFAVTYRKATLRLLGSAPGAFGQREGTAVQFEESSDGHLLVRVDFESGASTGGGSIALLEFQALKRGVSALSVQDVSYVEVGQDTSTPSDVHERSITVE